MLPALRECGTLNTVFAGPITNNSTMACITPIVLCSFSGTMLSKFLLFADPAKISFSRVTSNYQIKSQAVVGLV